MGDRRRKEPAPPEPTCVERECYGMPSDYAVRGLGADEPTAFNCIVRARRYRITIELIDEPIETIHARLLKLWRECDNHHHWDPLRAEARKYGLELDLNEVGCDRKRVRRG